VTNNPAAEVDRDALKARLQAAILDHRGGRLPEAEAAYRAILEQDTNNLDAQHLLGVTLYQSGRPAEAIDIVRRALARKPKTAPLHNTMGLAYQATGDLATAEWSFRQALVFRPDYAEALVNLGNLLREKGDRAEALDCYRKAVAANPSYAEAQGYLGLMLAEAGDRATGLVHLKRAVELRADHPELLANLGAVLAEAGDPEAERWLRRAIDKNPNHGRAMAALGKVLIDTHRPTEGFICLAKAVAADTRNGRACLVYADALESEGRVVEAKAQFAEGASREPLLVRAWLGQARCCAMLGEKESASAHYRQALEIDPESSEALAAMGKADFASLMPEDLLRLERVADDPGTPPARRQRFHGALAGIIDAQGDPGRAFAHMQVFNGLGLAEMSERGLVYDEAGDRAYIDRLIAVFDKVYFSKAGGGDPTELPVFVVGMPRSGTTLIEQILASHSEVHGAGELKFMGEFSVALAREHAGLGAVANATYPECMPELAPAFIGEHARRYLERLRALAPSAARIVDKMPGNTHHLGLIATVFPDARIIHCRRDPRDTCLSCYAQNFGADIVWSTDLAALGRHYRQYHRLMEHWRGVLPRPMLEVDYEATVADLEGTARRLLDFCGLGWEEGTLRFWEAPRPVRTASIHQVRMPIYTTSAGKWRRYESHLGPLIEALGDLV
jgi:Tfp pilus assembly protein PilF